MPSQPGGLGPAGNDRHPGRPPTVTSSAPVTPRRAADLAPIPWGLHKAVRAATGQFSV